MNRPTPEILYRYRHLLDENRKRTERLLRASVLYFASPAQFNDPFDCKIHYTSLGSMEQLRRKQQTLYKKFIPDLNRAERRHRAAHDIKQVDPAEFLNTITEGLQREVNRVGVLCLSEFRDDIVLWSHYAAGHAGLCLGFRVAADAAFFARAQPICYSAQYPSIDLQGDSPQKHVEAFILTKAQGWAYEREWRIVDHETGFGEKAFHPAALCEIVFGARMTQSDKAFTPECIADRAESILLYEARPTKGSYALAIERVDR